MFFLLDDVEKVIALVLRDAGDRLYERVGNTLAQKKTTF